MWSDFVNFIWSLFTETPPPANTAYGYRWQAGQGVPNQLTDYNLTAGVGPGVYVAFPAQLLGDTVDPFGRLPDGPGTVFPILAAPDAAMVNLITRMRNNPQPGEAALLNNVTQARLADLTGFLSYTNACLEILNATPAGALLFNRINNGAYSVFISPASRGGNQTFASGAGYVNTLTSAIDHYTNGSAMPVDAVNAIIDARYGDIDDPLARYDQLAADMNALPLCSLFVNQAAFLPNFLAGNFSFHGQRFTGQNLVNWLSPGGFAGFDATVRTLATDFENVLVRKFFLLALNIVLYPNVLPGAGTGAGIKFNVRNDGDNVLGSADFRPPAVGLAHELMHAMHYVYGTAPGYDVNHFTTTAAELLFVGIGPFANNPITENAVRTQYAAVPAGLIDPSNVWAAPARRTVYEPPQPPHTPATMRAALRCI